MVGVGSCTPPAHSKPRGGAPNRMRLAGLWEMGGSFPTKGSSGEYSGMHRQPLMQETPHASKDAGFSRCEGGGQEEGLPSQNLFGDHEAISFYARASRGSGKACDLIRLAQEDCRAGT